MSVLELKTRKMACKQDLIEILEESLERAKKGEFQSGAMFFVDQDSTICTVITKTDNKHLLIAGCNHLLHSMLSED
jgi:hypothetical protein